MGSLRLAFLGTPDFAVPTLRALIAAGHEIAAVYTQPPRPAGRGHAARKSPVHCAAEEAGISVRTPASLKPSEEADAFAALALDATVVAAYGLILPPAILAAPRLGCLNVHASLLPRWRGAAPIVRAILAGDRETGVSIMLMDEGLDTGPILATARAPVGDRDTAGSQHDRLAELGAELLVETLTSFAEGRLTPRPQPAEGVTYAAKIEKREAEIDWREDAREIDRRVRAFAPRPGASTLLDGERITVLEGRIELGCGEPGTVLDDALLVACGEGAYRILRLQRAGRREMDAASLLRGRAVPAGTRFG